MWDVGREFCKFYDLSIDVSDSDEEQVGDHVKKHSDAHVEEHSETLVPD